MKKHSKKFVYMALVIAMLVSLLGTISANAAYSSSCDYDKKITFYLPVEENLIRH